MCASHRQVSRNTKHQLQQEVTLKSKTTTTPKNNKNNSFVTKMGESVELLKANYERDEHKWNAERVSLTSKVAELERTISVN